MVNRPSDTGNGECLAEDLLSGYLEGILTPVVKAACEVHLISCDACRQKLADLMRILQPDLSEQEMAAVDAAVAHWDQRGLRPIPARPVRSWRRVYFAIAGLAAVVALAVLVGRGAFSSPTAIQKVFATSSERSFEAQMSNQPYVAYKQTRGPETNLEIVAQAGEMSRQAADAYEKGQLLLFAKQYNSAVEQLTSAANDPGVSSGVLNDLGVAYFQRNEDGDWDKAERQFKLALERDQKFLPAIFNLGLLYDARGETSAASDAWQQYRNLDSESGWAKEVRQKQEDSGIK